MKAKVFSFISAKGGTGKTVLSASFANFLGELNKKVLIIDADADTNGLTIFYLDKVISAKRIMNKNELKYSGILEADQGAPMPCEIKKNVDLIPATYRLNQTANFDEERFTMALERVIVFYEEQYDYIFIDAQAGSDSYAERAIRKSDEVVIISEYDPVSLAGIDRLTKIFSDIMPYEKRWTLFNKVLPEFAKKIGDIRITERILTPIPWDEQVVKAFALRKLALDTKKGNPYTLAITRTLSVLLGNDVEEEINNWKMKKSEELRKPIYDQLDQTKKELIAMEDALNKKTYELEDIKRKRNRFLLATSAVTIVLTSYMYILLVLLSNLDTLIIVALSVTVMVLSFTITSYLLDVREKRNRLYVTSLKGEINYLRYRLRETEIKYLKMKALSEYDVEKLIE